MIKVDNSAKRRIFTESKTQKVLSLKAQIEKKIETLEANRTYNYDKALCKFEKELNSKNLSVFKFKNAIELKIDELLQPQQQLSESFKRELQKLKKSLYLILVGDISQIRFFIKQLRDNGSLLIHLYCDETNHPKSNDYKKFQEIFEDLYKKELSNHSIKKSFFEMFEDINVCPYCNRNFINPIYKKTKIGCDNETQSPDIEHFFPKSMYPFLSLSISNLLPSCSFCNKIKSNVDTFNNCKSPYEIDNKIDFLFEFNQDAQDINKRNVTVKTKLNNSEILHLENLYNEVHLHYINDIYFDVFSHPEKYLNELSSTLKADESEQRKWYKSFFRNYADEADFNKHPLSKLTKDLFNHLNSVKQT
ncbi:hypothetical protein [Sulfurospirillum barnesii]|uniref:HNH nuclease domain-containing protein n=1 Tax=Sulfurospirillum barnesii (strain ATCC 700032 / DSM 10660 / SES-3) TaxID=760154 RepID=I3XTT7_SULBS|nr:hypothetical protein [Sulfurospirillum barnesii]AFL67361.1 hypothetical protein Sulba_0028 [Sulfurospirillum barnesii SES-3]